MLRIDKAGLQRMPPIVRDKIKDRIINGLADRVTRLNGEMLDARHEAESAKEVFEDANQHREEAEAILKEIQEKYPQVAEKVIYEIIKDIKTEELAMEEESDEFVIEIEEEEPEPETNEKPD